MAAMSGSTSAVSLKEILNLDKAELVFQRLLEAVQAHSSELAAVRRDVSGKASGEDLRGACAEINGRLAALERRVTATEAAVTIPANSSGYGVGTLGGRSVGGSLTVGEAVRAHEEALLGMSEKLAEKAGKQELSAKGKELEGCIRERERAVRQWGVGRDFADSLGRANRGLAGKLVAVEGVLSTKLDRSELENMQAACAKVSTVSDFLDDAAERVSSLEAQLEKGEHERHQNEQGTERSLVDLRASLDEKAERHASEAMVQDVADLRKAFIEETSIKSRQLRGLKVDAEELKKSLGNLSGSSDERLQELEACLQGAATKEELSRKADGRAFEESLRALRADCASRARQTSLSSLESSVSRLQEEHAKTRKATDLTGRFVDWFSSRGQAYEHNLAAVEKHIENLATRSVASRASPALEAAAALDAARGAQRMARNRSGGGDDTFRSDMDFFRSAASGRDRARRGVFATADGGASERVPYGGAVRFTPA